KGLGRLEGCVYDGSPAVRGECRVLHATPGLAGWNYDRRGGLHVRRMHHGRRGNCSPVDWLDSFPVRPPKKINEYQLNNDDRGPKQTFPRHSHSPRWEGKNDSLKTSAR